MRHTPVYTTPNIPTFPDTHEEGRKRKMDGWMDRGVSGLVMSHGPGTIVGPGISGVCLVHARDSDVSKRSWCCVHYVFGKYIAVVHARDYGV